MKARLLLLGVFLSLFVSASQAQDVSPANEFGTASPPASDSISTLSLSEMFEDPGWVWYLAACVDLYLVQADTVLSEDAYESPYAFFGAPEVQAITPGEMWVWLDENFPMDAANLAVTFDHWRSRAYAPDETAWLEPAPESIATDPQPGYAEENDGLEWFSEALSPSEPIEAPTAETAEMEPPPTASIDPFAGLSLTELFEDEYWLSYLAYCVDLYLAQADTVLSEDAYESPYAFFGAPEVQAITPGEMWVWLDENFPMDAANLAVTFDHWRSRAAIPAIDPAANEQALDFSADVNNQPSQIALPAEAPCQCGLDSYTAYTMPVRTAPYPGAPGYTDPFGNWSPTFCLSCHENTPTSDFYKQQSVLANMLDYKVLAYEQLLGAGLTLGFGSIARNMEKAAYLRNLPQMNRAGGLAAEARIGQQLLVEGERIVSSHVGARTSDGLRVIDFLIQKPSQELVAIEVKSGNAVRSAQQLLRDQLMATQGATLVGRNAPPSLRGQTFIIQTIERR